jgi:hypothetical protein
MPRPRKYSSDRPSTPAERVAAKRARDKARLEYTILRLTHRRQFEPGPVTKPGWSVTLPPARQPFYESSWEDWKPSETGLYDLRVIVTEHRFELTDKNEYLSLSRIWRRDAVRIELGVFDQTLWKRWESVVPISDGLRCVPYGEPSPEPRREPIPSQAVLKSRDYLPEGWDREEGAGEYRKNGTSPGGERPLELPVGAGMPLFSFGEGKRPRLKRHEALRDACQVVTAATQEFDAAMWRRQEDRDVVLPRMVDPINLVHADRTRIEELAALRDERLRRHRELWELKPEVFHINLRRLEGKLRSKIA